MASKKIGRRTQGERGQKEETGLICGHTCVRLLFWLASGVWHFQNKDREPGWLGDKPAGFDRLCVGFLLRKILKQPPRRLRASRAVEQLISRANPGARSWCCRDETHKAPGLGVKVFETDFFQAGIFAINERSDGLLSAGEKIIKQISIFLDRESRTRVFCEWLDNKSCLSLSIGERGRFLNFGVCVLTRVYASRVFGIDL